MALPAFAVRPEGPDQYTEDYRVADIQAVDKAAAGTQVADTEAVDTVAGIAAAGTEVDTDTVRDPEPAEVEAAADSFVYCRKCYYCYPSNDPLSDR